MFHPATPLSRTLQGIFSDKGQSTTADTSFGWLCVSNKGDIYCVFGFGIWDKWMKLNGDIVVTEEQVMYDWTNPSRDRGMRV